MTEDTAPAAFSGQNASITCHTFIWQGLLMIAEWPTQVIFLTAQLSPLSLRKMVFEICYGFPFVLDLAGLIKFPEVAKNMRTRQDFQSEHQWESRKLYIFLRPEFEQIDSVLTGIWACARKQLLMTGSFLCCFLLVYITAMNKCGGNHERQHCVLLWKMNLKDCWQQENISLYFYCLCFLEEEPGSVITEFQQQFIILCVLAEQETS